MYKIQTLNKISSAGLSLLPLDNYESASEITHPDAILVRSFKMHDMEIPESLLAIGRAGAGVNNIPVDKCSEKGIVVFNTPAGSFSMDCLGSMPLMATFWMRPFG